MKQTLVAQRMKGYENNGNMGWLTEDMPAIIEARKKHDAGTHDMFQKHNGKIVDLILVKRRKLDVGRKPWFGEGFYK